MSTTSDLDPNPSYAVYMAGGFASGARIAAHHAHFIEGRVRVRNALMPLSDEQLREVRQATTGVAGFSDAASLASTDARQAASSGRRYAVVALHASDANRFRSDGSAALRKLKLLASRYLRARGVNDGGAPDQSAVWNVPLAGDPTVTATPTGLQEAVPSLVSWIELAGPGDQLLITVGGSGLVLQVRKASRVADTWPWTVRVGDWLSRRSELTPVASQELARRHFVSHGGQDLWCHVVRGESAEVADCLIEVAALLQAQRKLKGTETDGRRSQDGYPG